VESAKGKGSTFTVVLPEAPEQSSSQPPKAPLPVGLPSRARLLIVDDEPAICEAIAGAFAGTREFVAATSADAAQAILEHDEAFDAIVCDLLMPERSGADLYRWIVERKPALAARTVFMSGGRAEDARRALGLPDQTRLISKPFDRVDFEAIVGRAMRATNSG
jgi:CheY-like chemotaxis protein